MKTARSIFVCLVLSVLLSPAVFAQADSDYDAEPDYNADVHFFAGGYMGDSVLLTTNNPLFTRVEGNFDDDFIGGFRLTYYFNPHLGIEGGVGFTPASILGSTSVDGGSEVLTVFNVDTYIFNANLVAPLLTGPVQPFVTGGVAAVHFSFDTSEFGFLTPSETDFAWNLGGGFKVRVTETVFLRAEGRYYQATTEFSEENVEFTEISGGVTIRFNF
jgi:opacity protein-like surface antigen